MLLEPGDDRLEVVADANGYFRSSEYEFEMTLSPAPTAVPGLGPVAQSLLGLSIAAIAIRRIRARS